MNEEYPEIIKKAVKRESQEAQEKLDYWNSRRGHRVKHLTYLLIGTIVDTVTVLGMSSQPRIMVKWDNGAESAEIPLNIELLIEEA